MKDKTMKRWCTYELFYIELAGRKVADIIITRHARQRWVERVEREQVGVYEICSFLWDKLKQGRLALYYTNEQDVYVVDDDLLLVAEFAMHDAVDIAGGPLYKMVVITFLGRMSETLELRDLRSYYAWLRHSRRMTLVKHGRKRR
ncbi:hypothetical protein B5M42_023055 [Paenibacillus athensensis]|uniref:Periplasmic protein n=1 Tax=Paenibacillus athensensis TaxID=1967502 RepID=A0A4Y8PQI6_9BACL|nr:hypothetical protein [Paenibacillus athensensis]MCD1261685.1 hypothetical protein [Paenibacillus athensensis]